MNTKTGEVKEVKDMTEEEKASGDWLPFFERSGRKVFVHKQHKTKSDKRREEYMQKVAAKRAEGENF